MKLKKNRILDLYETPPKDGVVVCYDECGPLEIRPIAGECWAPKGHPRRLRATYHRLLGTEQLLAFYDVHEDCLVGQMRRRKTHKDVLSCIKRLRRCYSQQTHIYLIMDNLSTHRHRDIKEYLEKHNIEPVWTPTYASWLNAIEAHFGPLKKFTLRNSDDHSHYSRRLRIAKYLTWRNKKHEATQCPLYQFRYIKLDGH